MRKVAAKTQRPFANTVQNAKDRIHYAIQPPPNGPVSRVEETIASQPSQKGGEMRRVAAKTQGPFANTAQNAKVSGQNRVTWGGNPLRIQRGGTIKKEALWLPFFIGWVSLLHRAATTKLPLLPSSPGGF